jgi:hypothetical protein
MLRKFFIIALLFLSLTKTYAKEEIPLEFILTVGKTSVQVGDFLEIRLEVTNHLNKPVVLHLNDAYKASVVKIIDRAGRVMPWERVVLYERPWDRISTKILQPHESLSFSTQPSLKINNKDEFVLDFVDSQIVLKRPGEYSIFGYLYGYDLDSIINKPTKDKKESSTDNKDEKDQKILFLGEKISNSFNVNLQR